ncbi:kinase-like domain-containing protein [Kalaharituber pfeilii]|nr:kinase-like domain-containing protein [Kalaharituber pfeilii]
MDLSSDAAILSLLSSTPVACTSVQLLSGGYTNSTWRGVLSRPLTDASTTVVIKHSKTLQFPGIQLDAERIKYEGQMMKGAREHVQVEFPNSARMGIPKIYHYDDENKVLVMQDGGADAKDLKTVLLAGSINSKQAVVIGRAIAEFASKLHSWGKTQSELVKTIRNHKQATTISLFAFYDRLVETIGMVSGGALEKHRATFEQVQQLMSTEMREAVDCGLIHGDYWTGNIIITINPTDPHIGFQSLYVIDWEVAKVAPTFFDIGQMAAEIFLVSFFGKSPAALEMLNAFLSSYDGFKSSDARCKAAIHFGVHLVVWPIRMPQWGAIEQREECAKFGADFVERGLARDEEWLQESVLGALWT